MHYLNELKIFKKKNTRIIKDPTVEKQAVFNHIQISEIHIQIKKAFHLEHKLYK